MDVVECTYFQGFNATGFFSRIWDLSEVMQFCWPLYVTTKQKKKWFNNKVSRGLLSALLMKKMNGSWSIDIKNFECLTTYPWVLLIRLGPVHKVRQHFLGRGGHCALNGVLHGHFLGMKMLQWNKSLRSFKSNFCSFWCPCSTPSERDVYK